MTDHYCETICAATLAWADGFDPGVPQSEIAAHLDSCAACKAEVSGLIQVSEMLNRQKRLQTPVNVWPEVQHAIHQRSQIWIYVLLAAGLLVYKLIEFVPEGHWSLLMQLVPLLIGAAALSFLRVNPFRINPELGLGKEAM